jgi:hypothetical protein
VVKYQYLFCVFCLSLCGSSFSQGKFENFLKPSDTIDFKRERIVILTEASLAAVTLAGLHQIWYADYAKSKFHFINDNNEWQQMDKVGHFYSAYHLSRFCTEALQWSGADAEKQLLYGAGMGFAFLAAVEIMDGYSAEWGASSGDLIANTAGAALFVAQELLWKEQRITPKFSFHRTAYAKYRPEVLGSSLSEQILKDYNGQTYWLSFNVHSFVKKTTIPRWLNVSLGYGAEGMIFGNESDKNDFISYNPEKFRKFFLSFDVNLTKIDTKSHFLKTIFSVFNTIKIPAPTLEYSANKGFRGHAVYF